MGAKMRFKLRIVNLSPNVTTMRFIRVRVYGTTAQLCIGFYCRIHTKTRVKPDLIYSDFVLKN